ncbi:hypothetical protein D0T50_05755 [Bacteroides sp. 214]|nr:hypothetical protein [Bacteroides sp. 214]
MLHFDEVVCCISKETNAAFVKTPLECAVELFICKLFISTLVLWFWIIIYIVVVLFPFVVLDGTEKQTFILLN